MPKKQNPLEVCPTLRDISLFFVLEEARRIVGDRVNKLDIAKGFNYQQGLIMIAAYENQQIQGQLADMLGINRNVMVALMDDAEKKGLLRRKPSPHKRGPNLIEDTAKAKRIVKYFSEHRRELMEALFHPAPPEQTEQVLKWAAQIVNDYYSK